MFRWLKRHPILVVLLVCGALIVAVPLAFGLHWWFWPSVPAIAAEDVDSIDVHIYRTNTGQKETRVTTSNPANVESLLAVLQTARRASDHKCGDVGTITVKSQDGTESVLRILPGHDPSYYEFRYDGRINRVDRRKFLEALQAIGVEEISVGLP
jgi:hypothetical protein